MHTLVFDVYGTLVDTGSVANQLEPKLGERAQAFAKNWRNKQLEYSYRMALMRWYQPFHKCAEFAFDYTCEDMDVKFSEEEKKSILDKGKSLPPFSDTVEAMTLFHQSDATIFAFSNGCASALEHLLHAAQIRSFIQEVVSIESIRLYKPSRIAYAYLLERIAHFHSKPLQTEKIKMEYVQKHFESSMQATSRRCLSYVEAGLAEETETTIKRRVDLPDPQTVWLISSNPFDVIGAKVIGLQSVWIRRSPDVIFDPWGIEPTLTVANLLELYDVLTYQGVVVDNS